MTFPFDCMTVLFFIALQNDYASTEFGQLNQCPQMTCRLDQLPPPKN